MSTAIDPVWLPPFTLVSPWTTNTYDELYELFLAGFVRSKPVYDGNNVWYYSDVENGKLLIFWHLTTREDKALKTRLPDTERSRRLSWARPMFDNIGDSEILAWDYLEGTGDTKTYIWLKNYDYVIILKKMQNGSRRLITAYWVEYQNEVDTFQRKYNQKLP